MTPSEFKAVVGWWEEGRLLQECNGKWCDWPVSISPPTPYEKFSRFSRSQDAVPLPVHVWVPDYGCDYAQRSSQWYASESACRVANNSAKLVRYVRADREFALSDFDVRYAGETEWLPGSSLDRTTYRLKTEAPR